MDEPVGEIVEVGDGCAPQHVGPEVQQVLEFVPPETGEPRLQVFDGVHEYILHRAGALTRAESALGR